MKTAQTNRILNIEDRRSNIENSKNNHSKFNIQNSIFQTEAFTLIELLVSISILAALIGGALIAINPAGQINKVQDAKRMSDIQQIKSALDLYYNDTRCYPQQVNFGNEWKSADNKSVYMKKVPQDPECSVSGNCYKYRTESNVCPQWYVVFAQVEKSQGANNICPLSSLSNCTPKGYSDATWACATAGNVDCTSLSLSASIAGGDTGITPTTMPGLPSSTPTPTISATAVAGAKSFYIAQPEGSNPVFRQGSMAPLLGEVGTAQNFSVVVDDSIADIQSVTATLKTDTKSVTYPLLMTGGVANNGTWSKTWTFTDTTNRFFTITLNAEDGAGNKSNVVITIK